MNKDRKIGILSRVLISLIRIYQTVISPIFPSSCRFYPSCSHYAVTAIEKYGPFKGGIKAMVRIFKCNPFFPGGHDPI